MNDKNREKAVEELAYKIASDFDCWEAQQLSDALSTDPSLQKLVLEATGDKQLGELGLRRKPCSICVAKDCSDRSDEVMGCADFEEAME